jgi:hypothetical protein
MSDQPQLRAAYHEAGHAVAARQIGVSIVAVSLDETHTRHRLRDSAPRQRATVSYAGPIAEAEYCRLTSDECATLWQDAWHGDRANIEKLGLTDAERGKARARAQWLVATHWRKIDALATALVERGEMTGDEVNELLVGVFPF